MNLDQIETKCFILALFIRDDGERFLLGSRAYEFKDSQLHFAANSYQNDIVEVQGNDGIMLAGQVRRATAQLFVGYIGDSSVDRPTVEQYRQDFFKFFRKNHYYKVVYVLPDGSAIQRRQGFIVEAPEVKELYELFPEYRISLNFEDINYYNYEEDGDGQEIYGESATLKIATSASGGLIWENPSQTTVSGEGSSFTLSGTIDGNPVADVQVNGDTSQNGTPTPANPQTVNTVTGLQTVTVADGDSQSQSYELNLGKNLLNNTAVSTTVNGLTFTINSDKSVTVNGTATANTFFLLNSIILDTTKQYTLSGGYPGGDYQNKYALYVDLGPNLRAVDIGDGATFTTNQSNCECYICVRSGITMVSAIFYPQIELGPTSTSYTPYFTPIELCKIGTYQDYIYKSSGNWYVHKDITKQTFDASDDEGWGLASTSRFYCNNNLYNGGILPASNSSPFLAFCNSFTPMDYDTSWNATTNYTISAAANGTSNPRIVNKDYTTLASFKAWLSANPVTLYYPIVTPTDTQITDAGLISQLEALAGSTTYDNQTIFTVSSANQLAILSLSTVINSDGGVVWDGIGATWEEGTGGGPTMIDVASIDNVYPVWELKGPAVNPQISVLTTNTTLSYTGSITASQTLSVDMFNKTATLNGVSVVGNISGDWVYLKPGINRVTYTTSNADAPNSTIWWQEIVG